MNTEMKILYKMDWIDKKRTNCYFAKKNKNKKNDCKKRESRN